MESIRRLISARLGIQVRDQDADKLRKTLSERCKLLRVSRLDDYIQLLQRKGGTSDREWDELAALLTTGETFFFRDKGQMQLLASQILPELMALRQSERSLRVWSAGCSSGEEPYSVAMLLEKLLVGRAGWRIFLLATDIDGTALAKAQHGIFTPWSFRSVEPDVQRKYFHQHGENWEIDESIKNMVTFQAFNLRTDALPSVAREVDLIICRNVFIYFDRDHVASIVEKFATSLRPGGYLLTGHGELQGQRLDRLETRVFSESVAYQRSDSNPNHAPAKTPLVPGSPAETLTEGAAVHAGLGRTDHDPTLEPLKQDPSAASARVDDVRDNALDDVEERLRQGDMCWRWAPSRSS